MFTRQTILVQLKCVCPLGRTVIGKLFINIQVTFDLTLDAKATNLNRYTIKANNV